MLQTLKHAARVVHAHLREKFGKGVGGAKRSSEWPTVRKHYLATHPTCEACAGNKHMQVHHCEPFHLDPQLELDPKNLIALCMGPNECHIRLGHGDDFKAFNPKIRDMAVQSLNHPAMRPTLWVTAKSIRKYTDGGAA